MGGAGSWTVSSDGMWEVECGGLWMVYELNDCMYVLYVGDVSHWNIIHTDAIAILSEMKSTMQ